MKPVVLKQVRVTIEIVDMTEAPPKGAHRVCIRYPRDLIDMLQVVMRAAGTAAVVVDC